MQTSGYYVMLHYQLEDEIKASKIIFKILTFYY